MKPHPSVLMQGSICCNQSAVAMRFRAGLTSTEFTLLPRSSTTSWTADGECLLGIAFLFHGTAIMPHIEWTGMVTLEQCAALNTLLIGTHRWDNVYDGTMEGWVS